MGVKGEDNEDDVIEEVDLDDDDDGHGSPQPPAPASRRPSLAPSSHSQASRKSTKSSKKKKNTKNSKDMDPYFIMHSSSSATRKMSQYREKRNEEGLEAFEKEVEDGEGRYVFWNQRREEAEEKMSKKDRRKKERQEEYVSNRIKTSKYNALTFLPKNLFEQFRKLANLYFLIIALLQALPLGFSPTSRYSSLLPLMIVLTVSAVKEAVEDYRRHQSDTAINNSPASVLINGVFHIMQWRDIIVGDIVKVYANEGFPADLLILSSSEQQGIAYVDTCNLDGETNLKLYQALPETSAVFQPNDCASAKAVVKCESPNNRLYNFSGWISLQEEQKLSLDVKQLLLRGCVLKNTDWVIGLVIYTGNDTKLMQNATKPPHKKTRLDKLTNKALIRIFIFMIFVCFIGAIGAGIWTHLHGEDSWYLDIKRTAGVTGALTFFSFLISFCVMIPISLYVSMEMVKVGLAYFIGSDLEMYYEVRDTPAKARTSNLSEELGQINYVFSDKTGTLTRNQMEFFKCSIAGVSYGTRLTEIAIANAKREGRIIENVDETPLPGADPKFTFNDMRLLNHLRDPHTAENIKEFLTLLSVCHTVVVEKDKSDPSKINYQAASPDEGALVYAAKNLGFFFHTRNPRDIVCNIMGNDERFEILNVLEFNSTRKRMSVICRDKTGHIKLYCKGADTVIMARLRKGQEEIIEATEKHLEAYASDGLRTLCLAYVELDEDTYQQWNQIYHKASISLLNRAQELDDAAELIEKEMFLLGGTAIEDKLQEGVTDTIVNLLRADIKIWVLTGDKQETAINIGYACSLLSNNLIVLSANSVPNIIDEMKLHQDTIQEEDNYGLVIDGNTLSLALDPHAKLQFLDLARRCSTVVCCRVSPLQKAQVVLLVKENVRACTLAIGDGANDVSMIQQAHIGVGISGQEGMQAVMSSDYAIAQFRYLKRLLLVHGRFSYKRIAKLILFCLYKNMVFSFVQFPFMWYTGFSGATMYDGWSLTVFNIIFSGLPIVFYGLFDMDVSIPSVDTYPQLYESGQKNHEFSIPLLMYWLITAIYQALVIFFGCAAFWGTGDGGINVHGQGAGEWGFGAVCYFCVVIIVNMRLALELRTWNKYSTFFVVSPPFIWLLWVSGLSSAKYFITDNSMYYVAFHLFQSGPFWLAVLLIVITAIAPCIAVEYVRRNYFMQNYHIVQECEEVPVMTVELGVIQKA